MTPADYCADIAKALEMGPTEGPLHVFGAYAQLELRTQECRLVAVVEKQADAALFSACHPAALRSILEEREQNRAAREQDAMAVAKLVEENERLRSKHAALLTKLAPMVARIRNLEDEGPLGEGWQSSDLEHGIAAIDAALKGDPK